MASILDLIGNTPIVDISALSPNPNVRIYGKLEGQNPGGSVKDRPAKWMIEAAEASGALQPGQTILESSSGNTGIALAMIARIKGYKFIVVLPENVSIERRQLLDVWGAEIIWSPGSEGSNGAMRRAQAISKEHPEWYFPYQYGNEANPRSHYESTGPEILRDVPDITHFVAGMGTGGTLMGVGKYLQRQQARHADMGHRTTGRRDGRRFEKPGRRFYPTRVHRQRRLRNARPQKNSRHARVGGVDSPLNRSRCICRHLIGRHRGRGHQMRRRNRKRRNSHRHLRRRLEVPKHRSLDRRYRRSSSPSSKGDLLLTAYRGLGWTQTSGYRDSPEGLLPESARRLRPPQPAITRKPSFAFCSEKPAS